MDRRTLLGRLFAFAAAPLALASKSAAKADVSPERYVGVDLAEPGTDCTLIGFYPGSPGLCDGSREIIVAQAGETGWTIGDILGRDAISEPLRPVPAYSENWEAVALEAAAPGESGRIIVYRNRAILDLCAAYRMGVPIDPSDAYRAIGVQPPIPR